MGSGTMWLSVIYRRVTPMMRWGGDHEADFWEFGFPGMNFSIGIGRNRHADMMAS